MGIRRKPKKGRLLILLVAFVVLIGLGAGAYFYRQAQLDEAARDDLRAGRQALETKQYSKAVTRIGKYLKQFGDDPTAHRDYALAISKMPNLQRPAAERAIASLRRALRLSPYLGDARHLLLELYQKIGFSKEAIETAERLLEDDSGDKEALWALTTSYARLREFRDARTKAKEYIQAAPDELKGYFHLLSIETSMEMDPGILVTWAKDLMERNPGDRKFELLLGTVYAIAGEDAEAGNLLQPLEAKPLTDEEYALRLVSGLDMLRQVELSTKLLGRAAAQFPTSNLVEALARRYWERGRFEELLEALNRLNEENTAALRPETEGLAILSLERLGRMDEAARKLEALVDRVGKPKNPSVAAWMSILKGVIRNEGDDVPLDRINAALEASAKLPREPIFHFYLGEAYERVGEFDLAVLSWIEASRRSFSWTKPVLRAARRLLASGYVMDATDAIEIAKDRWKKDEEIEEVVFVLDGMLMSRAKSEDRAEIMTRLKENANATQDSTAILTITTHVLEDREDEAKEAIRAEIAREDIESERVFVALGWIAESFDPDLAAECRARQREQFGETVSFVYFRAARLLSGGNPEEGLRLLEEGRTRADGAEVRNWDLTIARYLEQAGDDRAVAKWAEIGAAYPADIEVQIQVSEAPSVAEDRELRANTVDRLKRITGETGLRWKILQAKLNLEGDDRTENEYAEAVTLLSEVLAKLSEVLPNAPHVKSLRVLYSYALETVGNTEASLQQLALTSSDRMVNPSVELQLATGYFSRGERPEAEKHLKRLLALEGLRPLHLTAAASLQLSLGQAEAAVETLERVPPDAPDEGGRRTQLRIRALVGAGKTEQAGKLLEEALQAPDDKMAILAVEFYAMTSEYELAERWATRLDKLGVSPGDAALIRGDLYRRSQRLEMAVREYLEALVLDSGNLVALRRLLGTRVVLGVKDDVLRTFDDGFANAARAKALPGLAQGRELIEFALDNPNLGELLVTWIESPEWSEAAGAALSSIKKFEAKTISAGEYLDQIVATGRKATACWPVQQLVISQQIALGRILDGIETARAAALAMPKRSEPRRMLSLIYATQKRYDEALREALKWHELTVKTDPMSADRAIAGIQLERGKPEEAIKHLEKYVDRKDLPAPVREGVLFVYARALLEEGRGEEAKARLWPLIPGSQSLRRNLIPMIMAEDLLSEQEAVAWMEKVQESIPADSLSELLPTADGWLVLWKRFENDGYRDRGVAIVKQLKDVENLQGSVWTLIGMFEEKAGDRESALVSYRKALHLQPGQLVAMNNLAMVLSDRGEHEEALTLARAIVERAPDIAEYRDTLAVAFRNAGFSIEAIGQMEEAERLEPNNLRWKLFLAELNEVNGLEKEARRHLYAIDDAVRAGRKLTPEQAERLERVRENLR